MLICLSKTAAKAANLMITIDVLKYVVLIKNSFETNCSRFLKGLEHALEVCDSAMQGFVKYQ